MKNLTLATVNGSNVVNVDTDELDVLYGQVETITWQLNTTNYPGGLITSITFTPAAPWGNQTPNAASCTIQDDDENDTGADITYNYVVTCTYDNVTYQSDPKIVNKPKTGGSGTMEGTG